MSNPLLDQDRLQYIKAKLAASKKTGLVPAWPRKERELPIIEVEVDWVRFSTLNHRTIAEQRKHVHETAQSDLFTKDPMGDIAQKAQHEILCNQEGFDSLKDDLNDRGQQENAIITAEGILINGNRRVAALRVLLHENRNLDCRYVRCFVLPSDANASEILQLETELQVARDFKQEYSWVNQSLLIEELFERFNYDMDKVAQLMHRRTKEVREDYEKIQQVNQLVAISNGNLLHVDFEENESAFNELAQYIRNKNEDEKESVRTVYFLGTLAGVNYRDLRCLRREDASALVADELLGDEQLKSIVNLAQPNTGPIDETDDLLGEVLGDSPESSISRRMLEYVAGLDDSKEIKLPNGNSLVANDVRNQIKSAVEKAAEEAEEQQKDENIVGAPIVRLERAKRELLRVRQILPRARAIPGWNEQRYAEKFEQIRQIFDQLAEEN